MISPDTFNFLKELVENNNREWFQANKKRHDEARENVIEFTGQLIKGISKFDKSIDADADPKKCVLRIYRDIRFSKDKTPYKSNFGIAISSASNPKTDFVGYYIHIQPGGSFAAGGYWMPQSEHLKAIRQEIDYNGAELKQIINDEEFKKLFGDFTQQERLKVMPKGYSADHEDIDLLKLKSFVAEHNYTDNELTKKGAEDNVVDVLAKIYPLTTFLINAIS